MVYEVVASGHKLFRSDHTWLFELWVLRENSQNHNLSRYQAPFTLRTGVRESANSLAWLFTLFTNVWIPPEAIMHEPRATNCAASTWHTHKVNEWAVLSLQHVTCHMTSYVGISPFLEHTCCKKREVQQWTANPKDVMTLSCWQLPNSTLVLMTWVIEYLLADSSAVRCESFYDYVPLCSWLYDEVYIDVHV